MNEHDPALHWECRALRAEIERLRAEIERLGAVAEHDIKNLRAEIERLRGILKAGEQLKPHLYVPSTLHMGDCAVCGHLQHAAIHGAK
jgi:uncharacterized small protein (DUF1192 family)